MYKVDIAKKSNILRILLYERLGEESYVFLNRWFLNGETGVIKFLSLISTMVEPYVLFRSVSSPAFSDSITLFNIFPASLANSLVIIS
ncbi:hypothetical protein B1A75_12560 [Geobacillus sp. LEMMY01]|nr:hypothetical protein B1A75_12560 [Geobacillus sp. LEMMY01]